MMELSMKRTWLISLLIVALLAVAVAGLYGLKAKAREDPEVDLGNAILQVDQVEYYLAPTYNNASDNVQILFELTNKAGKDAAFEPAGQLTVRGASGKEYPQDSKDRNQDYFDLDTLRLQNENTQKLINLDKAKTEDILPDGCYRWGYCVSIDRGDKITSIIYKNGSEVRELDISGFKAVTHERPSSSGSENATIKVGLDTDINENNIHKVASFAEPDEPSNEYVDKLMKSKDKVDIALVEYAQAMKDYCREHPEILYSSKWEVGQGGPLEIIKKIDLKDYNKLMKHIRPDSPFCAPIMIAVEEVTGAHIDDINTSQTGVEKWKQSFNSKEKEARYQIEQIVRQLKQGNSKSNEQI